MAARFVLPSVVVAALSGRELLGVYRAVTVANRLHAGRRRHDGGESLRRAGWRAA